MNSLRSVEKTIGGVKFAVFIILVFAIYLIVGTFQESYHGTEYANRLIYKSPLFMATQFLMFLSIFIATLLRLPARKPLYGFYTLHAGLLILFIGSFVTFYAGIDGSLQLQPNTPSRYVLIQDDELFIKKIGQGKELIYPMPYGPFETSINETFENVTIKEYLPFADEKVNWNKEDGFTHSSQYFLTNKRMGEEITFSLNEKADFKTSNQLGPLSIHYLPKGLGKCFGLPNDLILWDIYTQKCIEGAKFTKKKMRDTDVILVSKDGRNSVFVPKFSPLPVLVSDDNQLKVDGLSPFRLFNRSMFKDSPNLFTFGESLSYYSSDDEKWVTENFEKGKSIALPWMGFELSLVQHQENKYPVLVPEYTKPIEENQQRIKGAVRAVKLLIEVNSQKKEFWVKKNKPVEVSVDGEKYYIDLRDRAYKLPFEITLERFKMDTDPGTNNPASYESFVNLFENGKSAKHHVFMNNPMKHNGMTFYQSSYFKTQDGPYGSVFSVNFDPGRWLKYLGSLLLVLGSTWHFVLRKKSIAL